MAFLGFPSSFTGWHRPSGGKQADTVTVNPLTYPKSAEEFSLELFKNPTSEYRGCPLWSWNTKLEKKQLLRQIDNFQAMGLGGFYMHVRIGLDTEYMGEEFMDAIRACVEYAEGKNMLACLYDEDRWPSGAGGGKVTREYPEHRGKHILFTPHLYGTVPLGGDRTPTSGRACRSENGVLLATYDIELDVDGRLKSVKLLKNGEKGTNTWYAYVETNPGSPWFNDQTYVDTLSKAAIGRFIESTHEVYKKKVGDKFGTVVPSIFTDEPQFAILTQLSSPRAQEDVFLPWTSDLAQTFKKEYSEDLLKGLPEIVWDLQHGKASLTRYRYHDHVCERFVSAFMDQIAGWCSKNKIFLNGHMMEEQSLQSQSTAVGEIMRCYRNMDMPGIDLLLDGVEYNTAKQASSVARQSGVRGVMSEIYGVSHWWFSFEGHKGCGDWQAALGVTFRVHHLTWLSMNGEGKRDYPASIGYQSPWFKEYGHVEGHFARVGVAMTRGHAVTRVGVIHPIESYWLAFGPQSSGDEMGVRDQAFGNLTDWLLHASIDFDFISESLLPGQVGKVKKQLEVGKCTYDVVIVPNLRTIRSTTLQILQKFSKAGGKVIIAGSAPTLIDAVVPKHVPVVENSTSVLWSQQSILLSLEEHREIKITNGDGSLTGRLLHQIRQDGDERFVFICNEDRNSPIDTTVSLRGSWSVTKLDTLAGDETCLSSDIDHGWTRLSHRFEGCASLLLRLKPEKSGNDRIASEESVSSVDATLKLKSVGLSEPNALLLDYAEYRLFSSGSGTGAPWSAPTEILRIDNEVRSHLKVPLKGEAYRQPWSVTEAERKPMADLQLRFTFNSDITIDKPLMLALEDPEMCDIRINGLKVSNFAGPVTGRTDGVRTWWVDECIKTLALPYGSVKAGMNVLSIDRPFGILTNLERVYILGEFGVEVNGQQTKIKSFNIGDVTWGDITKQGLPFYAGNVSYNCTITVPAVSAQTTSSNVVLAVPNFSSPVLSVTDNNSLKKFGNIAFQPRTLSLGSLAAGDHDITITSFGNRYNSFGHVHVPFGRTNICGPAMFRTGGWLWSDDYAIMAMGVLEAPSVSVETAVQDDCLSEGSFVMI